MTTRPTTRSPGPTFGPPLGGTSGDWRHRLIRFHVPLALTSAVVLTLWMGLPLFQAAGHQGPPQGMPVPAGHQGPPQGSPPTAEHQGQQGSQPTAGHPGAPQGTSPATGHQGPPIADTTMQDRLLLGRFTTATGYLALGLVALTLLIGPANLMLRRRNPVSSYLTRDVGMWAAGVSVVHVIAGLFVHGPPTDLAERVLYYFFAPDGSPLTNAFGWANWTGLAATAIVLGLLAISSNYALHRFGATIWKNIQRLNYANFALVIAHALLYGALSRLTSISTLLLGVIVITVFVVQLIGIRLRRRRRPRAAAIA